MTIELEALPPELEADLGHILCLTDARTAQGYVRLLEEGAFEVTERLNCSQEIIKTLDEVETKLSVFLAFQRLGGQTGDGPLEQTLRHIA